MGGPAGHRTKREHQRHVQHMIKLHHQPVRRVEDNAVLSRQTLYDGHDLTLDGLTDVSFRGGGYGRFFWNVDGADHYRQYLPPTLANLSAPAELMVAQMDYAGVDRAVLQTGHSYGRLNRFLADAVARFPERLWALAMVDEWRVDQPSQMARRRARDQRPWASRLVV